jgi:hypothetical protein
MAILLFCVVLFASALVTDVVIIQPFHFSQWLHLPQMFVWSVVFIFFAWIFGDDSSPWV